jgi:hypothetical protein
VIQMEKPSRYKTNNNDDAIVQHRLRLASCLLYTSDAADDYS